METSYDNESTAGTLNMSDVRMLLDMTAKLAAHLNTTCEKEEREHYIQVIQSYLTERDTILQKVKPPFTKDEEEWGRKIVALNTLIDTKMSEVQEEIKRDIKQLNHQSTTQKKYANPYGGFSADGMFFDKRN